MSGVVLGIDYGHRRIGMASGHPITGSAQPLRTITHNGNPFDDVSAIINEWSPSDVVVGLPLAASGDESVMSRAVRVFVDQLQANHPAIQFHFHDERFSSQLADARFKAARQDGRARKSDAANLDSHAAAVILESWLGARALVS